jgi:hypothetical protein
MMLEDGSGPVCSRASAIQFDLLDHLSGYLLVCDVLSQDLEGEAQCRSNVPDDSISRLGNPNAVSVAARSGRDIHCGVAIKQKLPDCLFKRFSLLVRVTVIACAKYVIHEK